MTAQRLDELINEFPEIDLSDFEVKDVVIGTSLRPGHEQERYHHVCRPTPSPRMAHSGLWRGYVSVYRLNWKGRLFLKGYRYPLEEGREDDYVQEELKGDFVLVLHGHDRKQVSIPFRSGLIVKDTSQWGFTEAATTSFSEFMAQQRAKERRGPATKKRPSVQDPHKKMLVVMLAALGAAFMVVPFDAEYSGPETRAQAPAGYHFVLMPPTPVDVCGPLFGRGTSVKNPSIKAIQHANRHCTVRPAFGRLGLTVLALLALLGGVVLALRYRVGATVEKD